MYTNYTGLQETYAQNETFILDWELLFKKELIQGATTIKKVRKYRIGVIWALRVIIDGSFKSR